MRKTFERGKTHVDAEGTRMRKGMTPGGRRYEAKKEPSGEKRTEVRSGITTWKKSTAPGGHEPMKNRITHDSNIIPGIRAEYKDKKGPTKVKAGYGKTHQFPDTKTKLRSGMTPGGRQYTTFRHDDGSKNTRVGSFSKFTPSGGRPLKFQRIKGYGEDRVDKGQTKPKNVRK